MFPAILNSVPPFWAFLGSRTLLSESAGNPENRPSFSYMANQSPQLAESRRKNLFFLQLATIETNNNVRGRQAARLAATNPRADCPLHGGQPLVVVAGVSEPSTRHVVGRIGPRGRRPRAPGEFFKEREARCWPSPRRGAPGLGRSLPEWVQLARISPSPPGHDDSPSTG